MALVPTASKAPTFAEVVAGHRQPSKEKVCHLLKAPRGQFQAYNHSHLPGINQINRGSRPDLQRALPSTLRPRAQHRAPHMARRRLLEALPPSRTYHRKAYKYQWDEVCRRMYDRDSGEYPPSTHSINRFDTTWTSLPTAEQQQLIDEGADELPSTIDSKTGVEIKHKVLRHSNEFVEIIHQKPVAIRAIEGIAAMRANKQLHEEIAHMLYSDNTFIFDTRCNAGDPSI